MVLYSSVNLGTNLLFIDGFAQVAAGAGLIPIALAVLAFFILAGILIFGNPKSLFVKALQLKSYKQVYRDLKEYYGGRTSYPQDKKSILATYALGGGLTVLVSVAVLFPPLMILYPLILPVLFGYYVRELSWIIHAEHDKTLIEEPFPEDRPAFGDIPSMTVDGIKAIGLLVMYIGASFVAGYLVTAVLHIGLSFRSAASGGLIASGLVLIGGAYVLPAFLARYAHEGTLSDALTQPIDFLEPIVKDATYFREVLLGTFVIGASYLTILAVAWVSPLLMPVVCFPVIFIATLQGLDHYARGYSAAVGVRYDDDTLTIDDDSYALPLRGGGVITPDRDRSILALGETGSGKTEAIKLLAYQFNTTDDTPFIAFDYKDDYKEFFGQAPAMADGGDTEDTGRAAQSPVSNNVIILSLEDSTYIWNIFEEVRDESEFEEIGRAIFASEAEESNNPYFPRAAQQVFIALLKAINRVKDDPSNKALIDTFEKNSKEELYEIIAGFDELKSAAAHLDPDAGEQSAGVYGHLQTMVGEIFKGDFRKKGDFSIRDYIEDPDGKTLILDFPLDRGDSVKPVYRLFIDWSIRHGLAADDRDTYYLLDEFQTVPGLERIERLVNAGRAQNAYGIIGLQSKAQLEGTYGEADASSILSGFTQELFLRVGDEASIEYVRTRTGRVRKERLTQGPNTWMGRNLTGRSVVFNQTTTEEEYQISEEEIQRFDPGEAIVMQRNGWRQGKLHMLEEVQDEIDQWKDRSSSNDDTGDRKTGTTLSKDKIGGTSESGTGPIPEEKATVDD
ncbi:type IV secretion system DNA-binding domain-containing protein [Natronorubrum thiooxidans]|uniref:Type IV secretion system coupling protein TraD DNA-binding domain-containing protein n=1 Tax=Natronorubrum thiooxidans TaxID=308853 RepID=A0A1N7H365_9EURY|nr:type IV secretion system DNA-binding domain-containing protein [Natronorubrum thiooxidans]SIS19282.1 Protein of unknown function [Natronorubrum thiooxidans]